MKQIVVQKEFNYQVDKNNVLVRLSLIIFFVTLLILAIARALIRNPKILLLDEGKKKKVDVRISGRAWIPRLGGEGEYELFRTIA
jgi:hypothetical protein